MAKVKPFKAIRPVADKVHLVATRSYVSYEKSELEHKLKTNPYSFLHVIHPDYKAGKKTEYGSPQRLIAVKNGFENFYSEGILKQDQAPAYYIYRQIKGGNVYTGIIGCASKEDYYSGLIKKHEATLTRKEEKLKEYLEVVDINAEPVCFTYKNHPTIDEVVEKVMKTKAVYDFSTTDTVRHTLWIIDETNDIEAIRKSFESISAIYIADGHHRSASSSLLGKEKEAKNPTHNGEELYNYFMGIFVPEDQLKIFDFNRVVTTIGDLSSDEFLKGIGKNFEIKMRQLNQYKPQALHEISMYFDGKWYFLKAKEGSFNAVDPVESLDASILSNNLLAPVLGITDLKTDPRIDFVGGLEGLDKLQKLVDTGKMQVAFALYPATIDQLKKIADTNNEMPPKTTWIEPKLRSGLTIYSLSKE